jgi:hypothetical protein
MYTAISFSIPDPDDNYVEILKTLRGDWGEAFHTGMSRGLLNWSELQKNPKGQVFHFSPINVPDSKLPEFTQRILSLGGKISTNWSAKDINARAVLSYVSEFPHAIPVEKVITSILADSSYNWDGTGREYLQNLIETLITEGRLIKVPDEDALTVNPSEESWQANQIFRLHNSLLINIRKNQEQVGKLLEKVISHWGREDMVIDFTIAASKFISSKR